mgnify:CR=1 FL=1
MEKVNLARALSTFQGLWEPRIIGQVNDSHIKLAKLKGEFLWHTHEAEDELFFVLSGRLRMLFRDREVVLEPGELLVVPRGVEHMPVCDEETHVLLVEPAGTVNTGDVTSERTVTPRWL